MIKSIVTDIEGTTSSIDFVHQTLFPYARKHMRGFLRAQAGSDAVQNLLADVEQVAVGHRAASLRAPDRQVGDDEFVPVAEKIDGSTPRDNCGDPEGRQHHRRRHQRLPAPMFGNLGADRNRDGKKDDANQLDDQERLAAHMNKPSMMMMGGRMFYEFDAGGGRSVGSIIRMGGTSSSRRR